MFDDGPASDTRRRVVLWAKGRSLRVQTRARSNLTDVTESYTAALRGWSFGLVSGPKAGSTIRTANLATPARDNITSLVSYFKDPMTYDGLDSISELHPSIKSADIFPKMRSLTDEDLFAIAGHILLQPKVVNEKWGGGKIYY